jgi:hypothetical protein
MAAASVSVTLSMAQMMDASGGGVQGHRHGGR